MNFLQVKGSPLSNLLSEILVIKLRITNMMDYSQYKHNI